MEQFDDFVPDFADWLIVPIGLTRDSGTLALSNYAVGCAMLAELDPTESDWRVCRFRHWAYGWGEFVLVRPESECAGIAAEIESRLAKYPVLDEYDYNERAHDAASDLWRMLPLRARVAAIKDSVRAGYDVESVFAARRDQIPDGLYLPLFLGEC